MAQWRLAADARSASKQRVSLIEQYVGYNYPKNLLIIPYKITLTRKKVKSFLGSPL